MLIGGDRNDIVNSGRDSEAARKGLPGQEYYLVQVVLTGQSLGSVRDLRLLPGMPAEVYIRTGDRIALDYL